MNNEEKPICQAQYAELKHQFNQISRRLNEIESVIGGTKRKWRDDIELRINKLENTRSSENDKDVRFPWNPGKNSTENVKREDLGIEDEELFSKDEIQNLNGVEYVMLSKVKYLLRLSPQAEK